MTINIILMQIGWAGFIMLKYSRLEIYSHQLYEDKKFWGPFYRLIHVSINTFRYIY